MSAKNVKILRKNIVRVIKNINLNNDEIWYRIYPLPLVIDNYRQRANKKIISKIEKEKEFVLYIHIPFCKNKCDYCSIQGACDINKIGSRIYINCLKKELRNILKINNKRKILSLFIGGGTPSLINPKDLKSLFCYVNNNFSFSKNVQFSMEMSPGDVTKEMAKVITESGINRICLGVQTFNEEKLKLCNRQFQKNIDVYNAVKNLRKAGLKNISFDLIYGLNPKESVQEFLNDNLKHIVKLMPENVAFYPLQNYVKFPETVIDFPSKNLSQVRKIIGEKIGQNFYKRYVGFKKKRNKLISKGSDYFFLRRCLLKNVLAIGLSSKSDYWNNGRHIERINRNKRDDIMGYKNDIEEDFFRYNYSILSKEASLKKYLIYNLNLKRGGVYSSIIKEKFSDSITLFSKLINNLNDVLDISDEVISLKNDYKKVLPFRVKNECVNYFIFSFCYLYSEEDQNILLKKLNLL